MKFGALYIVYDDYEYLSISLESVAPQVSLVLILINDRPWYGEPSDNARLLREISGICRRYRNVEVIQTSFRIEADERNYGLDLLQSDGVDRAFIIDADEIYHSKDFANIINFIQSTVQYSAYHIECDTYWTKNYHVIRPREAHKPVIAVDPSRFAFLNIRHGTTSVIRVGGKIFKTEEKNYNGILIPNHIAVCHHLSYARTNESIKRKLETASHRPEIIHGWYENVWLKYKLGDTNLHPITPSQYLTAVKSDYLSMPDQLKRFIKRERMITKGCSIIIPNWNSLELLKKCLNLVNERTSGVPFDVIIVDNGSKDGSVEFLKSIEKSNTYNFPVKVVYNQENLGFPGGINAGLRVSDPSKDVCLLNVDAEVQAGWLAALYDTLIRFPYAGMVGPLGNVVPSGHQRENYVQEDSITPNLYFFCVLILRELVDKIGGLDTRFGLGGYDDNDYGSRARFAGFRLYISAKSHVKHEAHQVFKANGLDYNKLDAINFHKYADKLHMILYSLATSCDLYRDKNFALFHGLYIPFI